MTDQHAVADAIRREIGILISDYLGDCVLADDRDELSPEQVAEFQSRVAGLEHMEKAIASKGELLAAARAAIRVCEQTTPQESP